MKKADLAVSGIMALFSSYLMVKSAELPIGWLPNEGPGGGAFPFWLSVVMLICSVLILVRNILRLSPEGKDTSIFMDREASHLFLIVLVSLTIMIGVIQILGTYIAVPLFLIFYMRYLGKHSWKLTLSIGIITPVATFILFEKILLILLPKGITEEFFYIFY